jgi:hypothetical protein
MLAQLAGFLSEFFFMQETICRFGALALLVAAISPLVAQSLPVGNASFESPAVPAGFPALPNVDGWQKPPPPPPGFGISADDWNNLGGIFPNAPVGDGRHITNLDGNQVAFVFPVPGFGLSQETPNAFTAGRSYSLQVALRGGGALTPGTQLRIGLYYLDGANRVTVGSTAISATEAFVSTSQLLDFSAAVPLVQSTDAWAGRNIGIELSALSQNGAPGIAYWELDNIRLSAVPEPGTVALALVGALALGANVLRRRS